MIVFYDLPNILSLPYTRPDGTQKYFDFTPGKTCVPDEIWKAIEKQNKKRIENYYAQVLKPFIPVSKDFNEKTINIATLSANEAISLIENTMEVDELRDYQQLEETRDKPRKLVLRAILSKISEIESFVKKVKEGKGEVAVS